MFAFGQHVYLLPSAVVSLKNVDETSNVDADTAAIVHKPPMVVCYQKIPPASL